MKNTHTLPSGHFQPKADSQGISAAKTATTRKSTKSMRACAGRKGITRRQSAKRFGPDDIVESAACGQGDVFQIYLNQIGRTQLLSKEQEAALGGRIRAGLNALLQHLLSSGCVGELLLEQTRAAMARKNCDPVHRTALGSVLPKAECVLLRARQRFVPGAVENAELRPDVEAVLGELVSVLGIWPGQGLELLAQVRREFSNLFADGSAEPAPLLQREFERRNLMDLEACSSFLAEGARLRAMALAARNELVDANLRLVVSEAKKMKRAFLSLEDLVQEGNCGLILAAERFDERLGHRFSTFAVRLIRSAMRRENDNQGRTIRLPVHRCDALRKLEEASIRLESQFCRPASVEQLSKDTGFACSEVRELSLLKHSPVSLDQKIGDDGELTMEAVLPDSSSLTAFYGETESAGFLDPYLQHLGEEQRAVVACVYGMGGHPQLTVEETAETLGITRSEVRRLHQLALESLRNALPCSGEPERYACAA